VSSPAPRWDDPLLEDNASSALFKEAVTLASRVASSEARNRAAWLLQLRGENLHCVTTSEPGGTQARGPYRVPDHPSLDQAVTSGQVVEGPSEFLIPVQMEGRVAGLLVVGEPAGLDVAARGSLMTIANIVGFAVGQAASVSDLQREAERSRRLERVKSEFLNIAAHELRSPLGIIRGYSSMLSEGMLPEAERGVALSRIADKAEEMARLISEMLETARLETDGLELELEPVDLLQVVHDAVNALGPMLGADHRFVLAVPPESIGMVADRRRLTTMLTNLLDNAVKYSPYGGEIEIGCEHDDRLATIRVRDHGIGINAEQSHLLFTRFGRLVTPETSHIRGTGLGLYLAREIARVHGGDILVSATPGGGSTFAVELPLV
jgi:signal transduction histidine kinase